MPSERDIETRPYRRSERPSDGKTLMKAVVGIGTAVALSALIGAHAMLWGHESRIVKLETTSESLNEQLQRIEQKLDRLIERNIP